MLSAILLTFTSFILDATSSPVYNMQPAYITANIGTTGRNIRNLPCISRKTSQSGVCMFAIDCLKSNGTHLGTCIDRFYFGSCCHIEPIRDIIDNSIDTSIFPEREPPERLSTTEKTSTKIFEIKTRPAETSTTSSTKKPTISTLQTSRAPIILTKEPTTLETTLAPFKLSTYQSVDLITNDIITTIRPITTAKIQYTTTTRVTSKPKPTNATAIALNSKPTFTPSNKPLINPRPTSKPTISTVTKPTYKPVTTTKLPTSTLKPVSKPLLTTKPIPIKLTQKTQKPTTTKIPSRPTRPIVKVNTTKPVKPTLKPFVPSKPSTSTKRPYIATKQTSKPVETTRPPKPTKIVTKRPIITATKPTTTAYSITTWIPITTKTDSTQNVDTTQKTHPTTPPVTIPIFPMVITKKPVTTTKPTVEEISTKAPGEVSSTTARIETTPKVVVATFTQQMHTTRTPTRETTTPLPSLTTESTVSVTSQKVPEISPTSPNVTLTTVVATSPPTKATTVINISSILEDVNGNPATNEIDQKKPVMESTTKSSFVTWTIPSVDNSTNITNGDWVPITTPDGWIQVPTVSAIESPVNTSSTAGTSTTIILPTSTLIQEVSTVSEKTTENILSTLDTSTMETNLTSAPSESSTSTTDILVSSTTDSVEGQINMTDFRDVCGRRMYPEGRIVGGEKASFGSWPWQISLRQWRTSTYLHKCGAALLNENWAITAAHCVDSVPPSDLLLRLGEHDLSTESEPYIHQERRVQIVASHPQFDPRTFEYDLALLRFYEPVKFQPNIIPVCVPQSDENFVGRTAYVTGWGRLYEDGPLPSILQEVSVPVINNTLCESMYRSAGYIEHIPHIFICAGWRRGGFDSCEGDSGGPMVIQRPDKRFLLAGVISWGIGCAEPNQPGVYTRISEFRDWINQILQF